MSESLHSSSWYRVAPLRPRLRAQVRLQRHQYRGERWYVLYDAANRACHRLSLSAHQVVGLMDGERTAQEIWDAALELLGDDAPTQDEMIRLLGILHAADALATDVTPDMAELLQRHQRRESQQLWSRWLSPLSLRWGLFDPDQYLEALEPRARWLFTRRSLYAWGALVLVAGVLGLAHWPELTHGSQDRLLAPGNLLLLALVYPLMKLVHELAHGLAARRFGCEVREMGILFIVFLPMPYVDCSTVASLPAKRERIAVSIAGILVESGLAALALLVWLAVEPGLIRALAYDVLVLGTLSTLLFNGNPLLKFDAYYALSDAIEIPNLAQRSQQYLKSLLERHVYRLESVRDPSHVAGERPWLLGYGIAASVYRLGVMIAIALFVAGRFFVIGVLLAIFSLVMQVLIPVASGIGSLVTHPRFGAQRGRALGICAGAAAALALLLFAAPFPQRSTAEGVIWPPERAHVRAETEGFVAQMLVAPRAWVEADQPILRMRDPLVQSRTAIRAAKVRELTARRHAERQQDLVAAQITDDEIRTAQAALARAREVSEQEIIRAPTAGTFVPAWDMDPMGRFLEKGELVGYVVGDGAETVRMVVGEADVDLMRSQAERVRVRRSSRAGQVLSGRIAREVPSASDKLPSPALGAMGGGEWPVDPTDAHGLASLVPVYQFDLILEPDTEAPRIGERVHVRVDHQSAPLAPRFARSMRRLFLGRFGV